MVTRRFDPRLYKLMAEALSNVEHALEEVRAARGPRRAEMRALKDAVTHYVERCDEWRRLTARGN